ncbi:AEC family transporter [Hydrogenophaga laconesensis]|uniref:Permease n=1 Tax=Hydrogenophaga laconesensis TaxID=1805971 RepID=A0ABU1V9C4_9BURK|nr:AEC family transporter [Hydrogenophaga laconesensis]MDR7094069.1 putative permease [Hydrogenophaga laconesensis]
MLDILAITGPIYLCIALGFAAVRWRVFSPGDMRVMGRFVIQFALPALLFNALASRPIADLLQPAYLLAFGVGSVLWLCISLWSVRRLQRRDLTESAYTTMGMTCGNSTFIGYPVVLLAIGPLAGVALAMNLLVENLIKLPLLMTLADVGASDRARASWRHALGETFHRLVRNPMIVAIVLGFVVSLLGWQMPSVIARTVNLFGAASGGLALFIIGGTLVGLQVRGLRRQVAQIAIGKLLLHPAAVWAAVMLLPLIGLPALTGELRAAVVLSAAMPMLGIYPLLAQRHGHEGFTAAALLAATVASFFTLSAILWVMRHTAGWLA